MRPPPPASVAAPPLAQARRAWMRALHRLRGFFALAAAFVAADQATKVLVRDRLAPHETWPPGWTLIHFSHVENTGAAFGILQGGGTFLIAATLVAVGVMTFLLLTLPLSSRYYPVALSLILGGAIGNLIDRVRFGAVTDFIDPMFYPAFNVADSCIVIGVGVLLVLAWTDGRDGAPSDAGTETTVEGQR